MFHLATLFPAMNRTRLALSRDQTVLLMAALNEMMLGLETFIAHSISQTIVPREWIPIIFGPTAGILLLFAGLLALKNRPLANGIATLVFLSSIAVGLLGAYFHIARAILPFAPPGERVNVPLLVWAPPILGPLTFALVGLMGISAAWVERPPDSGKLVLSKKRQLALPYSKTQAYFFMISMGSLATVISSVLDHSRTNFSNPWLWLPTGVGVFATIVSAGMGIMERPRRSDLWIYLAGMVLMIAVGALGSGLHILQNLTAQGTIVGERFLRGAPFLAPLLFSDMGILGLVILMDPREETQDR